MKMLSATHTLLYRFKRLHLNKKRIWILLELWILFIYSPVYHGLILKYQLTECNLICSLIPFSSCITMWISSMRKCVYLTELLDLTCRNVPLNVRAQIKRFNQSHVRIKWNLAFLSNQPSLLLLFCQYTDVISTYRAGYWLQGCKVWLVVCMVAAGGAGAWWPLCCVQRGRESSAVP